jgi:hypothetical protein
MEDMAARPEPQRWTPETMYRGEPSEQFGIRAYSREYRAELDKETYWERIEPLPTLSREQSQAVGMGLVPCPLCPGNQRLMLRHRGEVTGIEMERSVECVCGRQSRFWREFGGTIDSRFLDADLATLEPTDKVDTPINRQRELHAHLRAHPDASMLFCGPSGGGKTHLMACLYRHAVQEAIEEQEAVDDFAETVWWTSASVMLNQHVAWETTSDKEDKTDPRYVTEAKIQRAAKHGWKPRLYIDELDKYSISGYKSGRLYEIVNAVYRSSGIVCATMNKTSQEFAEMLKDRDMAESITRRIGADGGFIVPVP